MTEEESNAFQREFEAKFAELSSRLPYRPRAPELGWGLNRPRDTCCEDLYGPELRVMSRWGWAIMGAVFVALAAVFIAVALSVPF